MNKSRKGLFLYGLVMLLVLALTGAAWAAPTDTTNSEQKSKESQSTSVFKDVEAGDSNLIYINYLAKREIISGFPDGGFHPSEGLSRAQAATLLAKAAGLSSSDKKAVFKDVNDGHWAAGSITAAANAGYLKGYPDGNYHPEEKLTRAQGISLVLRLSKQKDTGIELPALKDLDSKHWAARSAAIGLAAGMVGLSSDKTQFLPDTVFSRGDLSRALAVLLTSDPDLSQVALNGSLEVKKGDVKVNDKAVTGTVSIKTGDSIATGAGAEAQLNYPDGSSLLIKENTKITVKETKGRAYIKKDGSLGTAVEWLLVDIKVGNIFGALATNPNAQEENSEKKTAGLGEKLLAGLSGALEYLAAGDQAPPWYKTAEVKKVKVKVDMPYGVAAIRGTFWGNAVNSNGSGSTSLLEGSCQVVSGGQTVPLSPGQSSGGAPGGAPPSAPVQMTPAQAGLWAQAATWLQSVVQNMQQNQEALRTEAGITQAPAPGQPAPQAPPTPAPPPALPNIMNQINQALTQVMQNAGFSNTIDLNNLPDNLESYIPPNPDPGPGPNNPEPDSGTSPSSVLAKLVNTPAYLQVDSITVNGSSLSLSGKTYPNNSVRLAGMLLQNPAANLIATANAYGNFNFSNVSINSSAAAENAYLVLDQLLDSTGNSMVKASLFIPNVLDSPSLPAMVKINRGLYTDDSTPVTITGQILPAQGQGVQINLIGAEPEQEPWTGTVAADGSYSIPIGVQAPGTQLGVFINPPPNVIMPVTGGGHTYVYAANAVGIMATLPPNGGILGSNTVQVIFDRSVAAGSNFDAISISLAGGSPLGITPTISGSIISFNTAGSLAADTDYTVNIPAGAIQDANNPEVILTQAFSFGFSTPLANGITAVIPALNTIPLPGSDVSVTINSNGLADNTAVTVQLYAADGSTAIGNSVNTSISNNAATATLTVPANIAEGTYVIIRVSGSTFSTFDSPFLISGWMGLVNIMNLPTAASCSTTALAGDGSGVYAAYVENNPMKPAVKKLDGMSWVDWGPAASAGGGYIDLSMNSDGDAYLAYRNSSDQATVSSRVYNSSTWTDLGAVPGGTADRFSLTTGASNPYLSYSLESSVQTYVYDSGGWNAYSSISAMEQVQNISLGWDSCNSKPYLAFSCGSPLASESAVYGYYYSGTSPTLLGIIDSTTAAGGAVSLAINSSGIPYVAYRDLDNSVMVKMYSGSSWTPVGSSSPGVSTANYVSLAFDCCSTPYVVYSDTSLSGADSGKATVKYCNDGTWETVGFAGFSPTAVTEPRIKVIGSDIYVIYKDTDNNIKVMQRTLALP